MRIFLSPIAALGLLLAACQPTAAPAARPMPPALAAAYAALKAAPDERTAEQAVHVIYTAWMQSGSPTVDVLMQRAAQAEDTGDFDKATRILNEAIALQPDFAEAFGRRAGLAFVREDYAAALQDLQKVIALEPNQFVALAGLGAVYEALNRPKEALKAYRDALAIHPRFEQAKQGEARMARVVEGIDA